MKPANDNAVSPWRDWRFTRTCDCGCQRFYLYSLDGAPILVCAKCEKDHTEAMFTNWLPRA